MLPLVRITAFYPDEATPPWGRGILFPRGGGDVRALGVLFNSTIFPQRKGAYSESWILWGGHGLCLVDLSDVEWAAMDRDRRVLYGRDVRPASRFVHRWSEALPYTT